MVGILSNTQVLSEAVSGVHGVTIDAASRRRRRRETVMAHVAFAVW